MPRGNSLLRGFAGVNLAVDPRDIADNELAYAKNLWEAVPGEMGQRTPISPFWSAIESFVYTSEYAVTAQFRDQYGNYRIGVFFVNYDLAPYFIEHQPNGLSSLRPSVAQPTIGAVLRSRPTFLQWRGKLYMWARDFTPKVFSGTSTGSVTAADANAAWSTKLRPALGTSYRGHLALAGFEGDEASMIRFTNILEPETLLSDAKAMFVGPGDGDRIVGFTEVPVIGGSQYVEPYLFVGKKRRCWMVQGLPPTSTTDGDISAVPLMQTEGLVAPQAMCWTPFGLAWCSGRNVWLKPHGGTPIAIADKLRPMLEVAPQDDEIGWSMACDGERLILQVPGAHHVGEAGVQSPMGVVEWWCDLRKFRPGSDESEVKWWGPMTIGSSSLMVTDSTSKEVMRAGATIRIDTGLTDFYVVNEGHRPEFTTRRDQYRLLDGSQFTIDLEARFKEHDFGDPMLQKLIDAVELEVITNATTTIDLTMKGEGGTVVQNADGEQIANAAGFTLGTSVLGTGVLANKPQVVCIYPPNSGRFLARTWQAIIKSRADVNSHVPYIRIRALGVRMRPIGARPR